MADTFFASVSIGENNTVVITHVLNGKPLSHCAFTKDEANHHIEILKRHADLLPESVPEVKQ